MTEHTTFGKMSLDNTTGGSATDRMERAYWLLCGIEMLANDTAMASIKPPYNAEETAIVIQTMAWLAGAELAPVMEAATEVYTA